MWQIRCSITPQDRRLQMSRDIKCSAGFCKTLDLQHSSAPGRSTAYARYYSVLGRGFLTNLATGCIPVEQTLTNNFGSYVQCSQAPMISKACKLTLTHAHSAQCSCRIQHANFTLSFVVVNTNAGSYIVLHGEVNIGLIRVTAGYLLQLVETEMSKPHRIKDSTQQGLVNVMWSFATLRYYPTKYFSAVEPHLEMVLPRFNDQELSNCLWAFGRLAHHPGQLVGAFCEALDHQVSFCNKCNVMSQRLSVRQSTTLSWLNWLVRLVRPTTPVSVTCMSYQGCLVI